MTHSAITRLDELNHWAWDSDKVRVIMYYVLGLHVVERYMTTRVWGYFKSFFANGKDAFILHRQYHGYWWLIADVKIQDISDHHIDIANSEFFLVLSNSRVDNVYSRNQRAP